jgi:hypothetical protein
VRLLPFGQRLPGEIRILCLSCNGSRGTGGRRALARAVGKKSRCACNEARLRRSQSNEEDR